VTPTDPIYTLRRAFEPEPLCSVFGFDGLRQTIAQMAPGLYMIRDGDAEAGVAERHTNGHFFIEIASGLNRPRVQHCVAVPHRVC
jgi:hypothetical protein